LCKFLEVEDVSNSPTLSIINEYKSNQVGTIYHLDLYRLKNAEDAIDAGVEDVLYSKNYCLVEWPEQALELMPDDALKIIIELMNDGKRKLIY
jgi:tRNA threonylcarbamoyladenosine biosynthesis protein TsaE